MGTEEEKYDDSDGGSDDDNDDADDVEDPKEYEMPKPRIFVGIID